MIANALANMNISIKELLDKMEIRNNELQDKMEINSRELKVTNKTLQKLENGYKTLLDKLEFSNRIKGKQ
jgi:hypothetical protein